MKIGQLEHFRDGTRSANRKINNLVHTVNYLMRRGQQDTPFVRGGGAGTPIKKAFCKAAASTGATIVCYKDVDFTSGSAYNSETTYDKDDFCTNGGYTWRSLKDDNTGNTPAESGFWTNAEITVYCTLIQATNLSDCFPTLADGTMMPVWKDGDTWRSLWWFQGNEECE